MQQQRQRYRQADVNDVNANGDGKSANVLQPGLGCAMRMDN
jgi:hypothetical protein